VSKKALGLIELIERDHRNLEALFEKLRSAILTGKAEQAQTAFLQLQVSEEEHFAVEERIMREYRYPHLERHKTYHDSLRKTMLTIERVLLAERPKNLHTDIAEYIAETLNHIEEADNPLQTFLRDKASDAAKEAPHKSL